MICDNATKAKSIPGGGQQPAWRYVGGGDIPGSEEQVVVLIDSGGGAELFSRARNGLVRVTTASLPR